MIELVVNTIGGREVYREKSDTEINFTGHLADGSMIEGGVYCYHINMQWTIDGETESQSSGGLFVITHYDGKFFYLNFLWGQMYELPNEPSPKMSIFLCRITPEGERPISASPLDLPYKYLHEDNEFELPEIPVVNDDRST